MERLDDSGAVLGSFLLKARGELFGHFHVNVENQMLAELENKNREVHNMRLPRRHFLFIFFRQMDGQTDGPIFWCHL